MTLTTHDGANFKLLLALAACYRNQQMANVSCRSSGGFVQNVIGCMNLTFLSAGSRPACRDGQSWSSAAAPYISRPGWHGSNPAEPSVWAWPGLLTERQVLAGLLSSESEC